MTCISHVLCVFTDMRIHTKNACNSAACGTPNVEVVHIHSKHATIRVYPHACVKFKLSGTVHNILRKILKRLFVYKYIAFLDDLSKRLAQTKLTDSKIMVPEMLSISEGKILTVHYTYIYM